MKTVKYLLVFILGLLASLSTLANFENNKLKESASKTIIDFCQSEFIYNLDNRYDLIKTSPEYKARINKLGAFAGDLQIAYAYEIYAIKSYKILDLTIKGNEAIATVSYDVLAKRTGWKVHEYDNGTVRGEAKFIECPKPNYIEKINLTYDGKRWWVLDPPFPKISVSKIIDFFEAQMQRLEKNNPKIKIGQAPSGPQDGYNEDQRNLLLLKELARE